MTSTGLGPSAGHYRRLVGFFCLWKALLLGLAAFCPGPGYDTSAYILFDSSTTRHLNLANLSHADQLVLNLFRWDALYFVDAADHGQVHEQQWAFSWAYSHLLRVVGQSFPGAVECPLQYYIVAGIIVSNVCHLLSVLVLYRLLALVLDSLQRRRVAFVASVLHILTPASLFMSAPYAESLFSLLNFTGMLCYVQSKLAAKCGHASFLEDVYKLSSGLLFASATLMRSNGLLSGLILLYDVGRYIPLFLPIRLNYHNMRSILVTCVAGMIIICGFLGPQYVAYREFCGREGSSGRREWCDKSIPSIYSWVQSHYWNVGFFRYWTASNLPLFVLAAPMLWLLIQSSVNILHTSFEQQPLRTRGSTVNCDPTRMDSACAVVTVPELALPQLVLAIAAVTSFHVQIVNRIASGYPIWYITIAEMLTHGRRVTPNQKTFLKGQGVVRGMIMYTLVQGMLYANFLPPA
ncbi:similar to GPI mannosyltransferase 2 [Plenodomus lingam JN3]|uniref:GPI mannosyltransferase 2 n=1 Tax=Leptosphaeria maculans (strain JN3 / isolate v23.1.3 / race Av1-4-5-6-7-8) TaxID=985895 RepID=E4ZSI8_LEPMJ|nr:similar to GPI mannosyltransferase 2 [Plenodomus lingam JN3]CBX94368.1 similar to GPI mannosyltransferase 2 [Plenodomus lingam JN3]